MNLMRPGFAATDSSTTFRQFPQRDEATMATIEEMNTPGWSNEQGDSNAKTVTEADSKVVESQTVQDKSVKPRKTAARKKA